MKKGTIAWLVAGAIVVVSAFSVVGSYNGFVNANENVDQKWAQIDNQLQRRADLIPNLVNTVKGYAAHEDKVIKEVSDARAKLAGATTPADKAKADQELTGSLSRLLMVTENYPNLKADKQFVQLQDELAGTENRIATARKDYNDNVTEYNKKVKRFPGTVMAGVFGFDEKEYFKVAEESKTVPKVEFGGN